MGKYKKLSANVALMTLGQFSSKILCFLLVPLYTYVLSSTEYAGYDLIVTTVSLLSPLLTAVVFEGVMRFCLDKAYNHKEILTIGLFFTIIGTVILILLYPVFYLQPFLHDNFVWLVIYFFGYNLYTVLVQYLKGVNRVRLYSFAGIISTILTIGLNIWFLLILRWTFVGYMLANVIGNLVTCVIICFSIHISRLLVNPFRIKKEIYKSILKYTGPMIPNSVSWWVSNSSDKYTLVYLSTMSVMGVYSVAYKLPSILSVFTSIFMGAWQISAIDDFGTQESKAFYSDVYKVFSSLILMGSGTLIFLSKYISYFFLQKDFFSAWKVSTILMMAFIFNSLSALLGSVYTSAKKTKMLFYSTTFAAVLNIVLNIALIPFLGMYGAAIATLLSYVFIWVMRYIDIGKFYKFKINLKCDIFSYILIVMIIVIQLISQNLYAILASGGLLLVLYGMNIKLLLKTNFLIKIKGIVGSKLKPKA